MGAYLRTRVVVFDQYGLDVGCNYKAGASDITVYLTRRAGALGDVMADAKRGLLQVGASRHPALVSDTREAAAGLTWLTAIYAEDGDRAAGRVNLLLSDRETMIGEMCIRDRRWRDPDRRRQASSEHRPDPGRRR